VAGQRQLDRANAVDAEVGLVHPDDVGLELLVARPPAPRAPGPHGVVGAWCDFRTRFGERAVDRLSFERLAMLVEVVDQR
jgi:hypothetical protein